jgi:hypothetical protein
MTSCASAMLVTLSFTVLLIAFFLNVRNDLRRFSVHLTVCVRAVVRVMHSTVRYNNGWFLYPTTVNNVRFFNDVLIKQGCKLGPWRVFRSLNYLCCFVLVYLIH